MSDSLDKARDEFINLFVRDVEEYASSYKQSVREQPTLHAMRIVVQCDEREVRALIANLNAERRKVKASEQKQ